MVHGIVNGHEGAVTVESEPYKGTRAHVFLPDAEPAAVTEPALLDTLQRGNERILLVDDEPSVIQMGRHTIERLGYTVTTASSSTETLEMFRSDPVTSDMSMPEMTGKDLAQELMVVRPTFRLSSVRDSANSLAKIRPSPRESGPR